MIEVHNIIEKPKKLKRFEAVQLLKENQFEVAKWANAVHNPGNECAWLQVAFYHKDGRCVGDNLLVPYGEYVTRYMDDRGHYCYSTMGDDTFNEEYTIDVE